MVERPILFNGAMVDALLAGRKTQTRRLLPNSETLKQVRRPDDATWEFLFSGVPEGPLAIPPRINIGDRMYVCETHFRFGHWEHKGSARTKGGKQKWHFVEDSADVLFDAPFAFRLGMHNADPATPAWHKRMGRFMFKKHSRLTLQITGVRIERLRDISYDDAKAEGLLKLKATGRYVVSQGDQYFGNASLKPTEVFSWLWDSINPGNPWTSNPWVVVYTFVTINANIDQVAA